MARNFWFVEVSYLDGAAGNLCLPVQIASGDAAHAIERAAPQRSSRVLKALKRCILMMRSGTKSFARSFSERSRSVRP